MLFIKLSSVASDITGVSGRLMLQALKERVAATQRIFASEHFKCGRVIEEADDKNNQAGH